MSGTERGESTLERWGPGLERLPDPYSMLRVVSVAAILVYWMRRTGLYSSADLLFAAAVLVVGAVRLIQLFVQGRASESAEGGVVLLLAVGALVPATLLSEQPRLALEASLPYLVGIAAVAFVAFGGLTRVEVIRALIATAGLASVFVIADFVDQVASWSSVLGAVDPGAGFADRLPPTLPRATVTGSHPNLVAMRLEVGLIFTVGTAVAAAGARRALAVGGGLVIGVALVLTGSRSGVIGGFAGLILLLVGLQLASHRVSRRWLVGVGWVGVGSLFGLGVAYLVGFRPAFLFRATLSDRLPVFSAAADMFRARPLVGNGVGSFAWLADDYLEVYSGTVPRTIWNHAHNSYLQILEEVGVIGVILLLGALAVGVASVRKRWPLDRLDIVLCAGITALMLHALTDHVLNGAGMTAIVGLIIGALLQASSERTESAARSLIGRAASVGAILVIPVIVMTTLSSTLSFERGRAALLVGDAGGAAREFGRASAGDPLPLYAAVSRLATIENGNAGEALAPDIASLRAPISGSAALNEIELMLESAPGRAAELLDQLVPKLVHDEVALIQAGLFYERLGMMERAIAPWALAIQVDPRLSDSELWDASEWRSVAADRIVANLAADSGCDAHFEVLTNSRISRTDVESVFERCEWGWSRWAAAAHLGRSGASLESIDARLKAVPDDPVARRFAGLADLELGDMARGRRNLAIAAMLGDAASAVALLETYGDDSPPGPTIEAARVPLLRRSPVVGGSPPVYVLSVARSTIVHSRSAVPSTLVSGEWELAVPAVEAELTHRLSGLSSS